MIDNQEREKLEVKLIVILYLIDKDLLIFEN